MKYISICEILHFTFYPIYPIYHNFRSIQSVLLDYFEMRNKNKLKNKVIEKLNNPKAQ